MLSAEFSGWFAVVVAAVAVVRVVAFAAAVVAVVLAAAPFGQSWPHYTTSDPQSSVK